MDAILQVHKNDPCASMFVTHLLKRIQAPFFFIEARPSAVGLMEARGIAGFDRGNAWTSWISWNRVKTTERFPDVPAEGFKFSRYPESSVAILTFVEEDGELKILECRTSRTPRSVATSTVGLPRLCPSEYTLRRSTMCPV